MYILPINKTITILISLFLAISWMIGEVSAAYWIVGLVNDATDGTPANGHTVMIYQLVNGKSDNTTGIIDVDNIYMIDCELLNDPCAPDDVITVEVIDNGDGYIAGPVNVTNSGIGWDQAPDMTLKEAACDVETYAISVSTDEDTYYQGETVTISGTLINSTCEPVLEGLIGIQVDDPNDTPFFVNQTNVVDGEFSTFFTLPSDALLGEYTVYATFGDVTDDTVFTVIQTTTTTQTTTTVPSGGGGGVRRTTTSTTTTTEPEVEETTTTVVPTPPMPEPTEFECGNGECEIGETQENCCSDCGCPEGQECDVSTNACYTPSEPIGITGAFLTAISSIGYWWILIAIIIILLIVLVWKKYGK